MSEQPDAVCPGCYQPPDAPCGECGRWFDQWAIHYTTTICAVCGDVYQIEYRVCEQCDRRMDQPDAVREALDRQRRFRQDGGVTMTAETSWKDAEVLACEVERCYRHLDRFMDAADAGFQAAEVEDINEPEPASDVYQWARNYAYSIRYPDSPMGQVLTMRDTAATAPLDAGDV
jgi:hypothetical protein